MDIAPAAPRSAVGQALAAEAGSLLIEVIVTAALLLVVTVGVLQAFDSADARGREQKVKAIAANLAQTEQERLRALPLDELSNSVTTSPPRTVDGVVFRITSRATWVTDATGVASCSTGGERADYLKISSTVSSIALGNRKPVTIDSLLTPPARSFLPTQGGLSVQIVDRNGAGVAGVPLSLTGPRNVSGVTNANGCVLWGYLPAATTYQLSFSQTGSIEPDGSSGTPTTQSVVGEQTRNVVRQYDKAGTLHADFVTKRHDGGPDLPTSPAHAVAQHNGPPGVSRLNGVAGSHLVSQPLFPFTSPYAVYADTCAAARPPAPAFIQVLPGETAGSTPPEPITLPSLDFSVTNAVAPVDDATVTVTTACGTTYERRTGTNGLLADPGFPWGSGLTACVTNGLNKWTQTLANTTLPGQLVAVDLATAPAGTSCP